MIKKDKDEIFQMFSEAFHEIVPPLLENVAEKSDIYRVERKIEKIDDRLDRHGKQLDNHEEKIQTLETASL